MYIQGDRPRQGLEKSRQPFGVKESYISATEAQRWSEKVQPFRQNHCIWGSQQFTTRTQRSVGTLGIQRAVLGLGQGAPQAKRKQDSEVCPASGSFPVNWLFTWSGQTIGASASASVLPMNIQGRLVWSPCNWRDSEESSPAPQFKSINSSALSLLHGLNITSVHDY